MEIEQDKMVVRIPLDTAEFIFSSLGGFTTTLVYLISAAILDNILKDFTLANFISLCIAVALGYGIQKGVFTLRKTPSTSDLKHTRDIVNPTDRLKKVSRYLLSEGFGVVIHQMLFVRLLTSFPVKLPLAIQNTVLRIVCNVTTFFVLFFLRKYWVFM